MSTLPIIFVSHAARDDKIAARFKADVENSFAGKCTLFVSSDLRSLRGGEEWLAEIKKNLNNAVILLGVISPWAKTRPWIDFEFGTAWLRDLPAIPLCHSGLSRDMLDPPLFQALNLPDETHLEHLYIRISETLNCNVPKLDYMSLASEYDRFSEVSSDLQLLLDWTTRLLSENPSLRAVFDGEATSATIDVPLGLDHTINPFVKQAGERGYLIVRRKGTAFGASSPAGNNITIFEVSRGPRFSEVLNEIKQAQQQLTR